eukprot:228801-Chlamydomonas_euryale.AAC.1
MAPCMGAEQMAFLPGRDIRNSLMEVFVVLAELAAQCGGGAVVLLDIVKAYDTVDRDFLFTVMAEMGASEGMLRWVRLLLHDTRASVHANGVELEARVWGCRGAPRLPTAPPPLPIHGAGPHLVAALENPAG